MRVFGPQYQSDANSPPSVRSVAFARSASHADRACSRDAYRGRYDEPREHLRRMWHHGQTQAHVLTSPTQACRDPRPIRFQWPSSSAGETRSLVGCRCCKRSAKTCCRVLAHPWPENEPREARVWTHDQASARSTHRHLSSVRGGFERLNFVAKLRNLTASALSLSARSRSLVTWRSLYSARDV